MPRKVRELIRDLERAGFVLKSSKGSHKKFVHPKGVKVMLAGNPGEDVKIYQEKDIKRALEEVKNEKNS
jgi:predicted RNA binding protein YcfA (HicA-like mRNA interferase family)